MIKGQREYINQKISDYNLIRSMRVLQKFKQPPYIPFYTVMTYEQIAEYYGVPEKRVRNIVSGNRKLFECDSWNLSGSDISVVAKNKKDLGKHYGIVFTFPNGIQIHAAYNVNTCFDSTAILRFAIFLSEESRLANQIFEFLRRFYYDLPGSESMHSLPRITPWFMYENNSNSSESDNENSEECAEAPDITINIKLKGK